MISRTPWRTAHRSGAHPVRSFRLILSALLLGLTAACSPSVTGLPHGDPVGAYEAIVRWLYVTDDGLNSHTFAIDTSHTGLPDPSRLLDALRADPRYAGHEIIEATRAELEEQGLISAEELYFPGGFLVEFANPTLTGDQVTVDGTKWVSGTGAIYATLTARWTPDGWVVDEPTSMAIS